MKINFVDFWGGFDPANNFLLYLFKETYGDVELASIPECDYVIYSCFGNNHYSVNRTKTKKIFYTGENKRPDFNYCDYSLTFDFDDYNGRNIRIPLYYFYIDWFNTGTWGNPEYIINPSKLSNNEFIETPKNKFCATVFSNPIPIRFELFKCLSKYKQVDGYGNPFNNHSNGEYKKYQILSEYKFSICPENSSYDGYYTEKLLHAKTAGTIPIYLADKGLHRDFNTKSFIDISNFNNLEELLDFVKKVDNDDELYHSIFNEPLFNNPLSIDKLKQYLRMTI